MNRTTIMLMFAFFCIVLAAVSLFAEESRWALFFMSVLFIDLVGLLVVSMSGPTNPTTCAKCGVVLEEYNGELYCPNSQKEWHKNL